MIYSTFEDWFKRGRVVMRGQRAKCFNEHGIALFSKEQTVDRFAQQYSESRRRYHYKEDYQNQKISGYPEEFKTVYFADGSGYLACGGPCGPLYFDRNGEI